MATIAELRGLFQRMGFSAQAATYMTDVEEVNSLTETASMKDADVEKLCKTIRRPGGMIPNPVAGVPAMIANPGIPVSTRAERNMKMLCYYLRYYARVSRTPSINGITLLLV